MKKWSSTEDWTTISRDKGDSLMGSSQARSLARENWPTFAATSTQFQRLVIYSPKESISFSVPNSDVNVIASMHVERYDPNDLKPWNNNFHLIALSTSGEYHMSPPIRPEVLNHHSTGPLELPGLKGPPPF